MLDSNNGMIGGVWRFDDIEIFVAVVEQGSFIGAANLLGMPTSTVSRRIGELEAALEMKLLERTSRRMRVTDGGQLLFDQCLPHIKEMRQRVNLVRKSRNQLSGVISLTAPSYLGRAILNTWLCRFLTMHPHIEVDLQLSNDYEDLIGKGFDLAIRIGPLKSSQFVSQQLFAVHYGLYASPRYLGGHAPLTGPADLAQHEVMTMPHQQSTLQLVNGEGRAFAQQVATRMRCNDIEMARQAAINGFGIACLPRESVLDQVAKGELIRVLASYEIVPQRDVFVVYPSRKHLAAKTRLLIDFLKTAADQQSVQSQGSA